MKHTEDVACGPILAPIMIGLYNLLKRESEDPEIKWEIRLFAWILNHPQAEERALEYARSRHLWEIPDVPKPKRQVVRELGWSIP